MRIVSVREFLAAAGVLCALLVSFPGDASAAGDRQKGKAKAGQCAVCHGRDGLSRRPDVPHIAGQSEIYLAEQLRRYRSGARTHPQMNVIAKNLSDDDIADLVAWYSSIELEVRLPE